MQLLANQKLPFCPHSQSQPAKNICNWISDERSKGKSVICSRLRQTGCNEILEGKIVNLSRILTQKPAHNRPAISAIIVLIEDIEADYRRMAGEGENNDKEKEEENEQEGKQEEKKPRKLLKFKSKISASKKKKSQELNESAP